MELDSYDLEHLHYKVLLYQTGYITFGEKLTHNYYRMKLPNKEVKLSFNNFLWTNYSHHKTISSKGILLKLQEGLNSKDFNEIKNQLNIVFSSLPYDFMAKEKEVVFHAIIHLTFSLLGEFVISEVHTHHGRCDALVITSDAVFCFEFKLGKSAQIALNQIREKGYLNAYKITGKHLYGIGVNYNKTSKMIDDFEWLLF